jgi:hypothetical protein
LRIQPRVNAVPLTGSITGKGDETRCGALHIRATLRQSSTAKSAMYDSPTKPSRSVRCGQQEPHRIGKSQAHHRLNGT